MLSGQSPGQSPQAYPTDAIQQTQRNRPNTTDPTQHTRPEVIRLLVQVRDNNVDQALKALKKKMQREGIFREMKLRNYYEKPSEKRVREQAEAVRRARKLARKRAQREGLLPGKAAVK